MPFDDERSDLYQLGESGSGAGAGAGAFVPRAFGLRAKPAL